MAVFIPLLVMLLSILLFFGAVWLISILITRSELKWGDSSGFHVLFSYVGIDHYEPNYHESNFTIVAGRLRYTFLFPKFIDYSQQGEWNDDRWWGVFIHHNLDTKGIHAYWNGHSKMFDFPWAMVSAEDGEQHIVTHFSEMDYYDPFTKADMKVDGYRYYVYIAPKWFIWCKWLWQRIDRIEVNFPTPVGRPTAEGHWKGGTHCVSCMIDKDESIETFLSTYAST